MINTHSRAKTYWIISISLILGTFGLGKSTWFHSMELHTSMEVLATTFALFVGSLSLLRYYSQRETIYLVLGTGFVSIGMLNAYHTLVSSDWLKAYLLTEPSLLINWSWLASRTAFSSIFIILYLVLKYESKDNSKFKFSPLKAYSFAILTTLGIFLFFSTIPLTNNHLESNLLHRPEEYIPAGLLVIALIGHIHLGYWRNDIFLHWLIIALIVNLIAQLWVLAVFNQLLGLQLDVAHLLIEISYLCVLIGLGISVFMAFKEIGHQSEYRKKTHLILEASETRNKAMMNTLIDSLIIINEKGIIENINPAACRLFGYAKLEVLGRNIKILMPNPYHDDHDGYLNNYLRTGNEKIINLGGRKLLGLNKDGSTFPIDLSVSEMKINGKRKFTGIIRDDTERLNNENELIKARNEAQIAAEAKTNFLASMSHEIRTPMNGVLGMVEILQDTSLDEQQKDILKTISDSGSALLDIINDILEYSKVEAGKIELELISFNLEQTIYDVIRLLHIKAEEKNLELIFYYHANCPAYVIGDAGRIRQVLLNLIGNAIKFTHKGQIIIEVHCLELNEHDYNLRFEVIDSGIGIDKQSKEKLFESFSQADSSTSRKYGGSGLGLSISKRLIELMQGTINVDSTIGKGSTFWFELNLEISESPEPIEQAELAGTNILIVDDNSLNIKILKAQLEKRNIQVSVETNPDNTINNMLIANQLNNDYQLVIISVDKNSSSEDLGQEIKDISRINKIPLILLTSDAKSGDAMTFKNAGFSSYLTKPILSDLLYKTLSRALGLTKNNDDNIFLTRHSVLEDDIEINKQKIEFQGHILLVEDVIVNQTVALGLMSNLNLVIDIANNGQEAIEKFNATAYDLILMDCQMPIMDGYEATQIIRESNTNIPIVALTANALASDRLKCTEAGMTDYLAKPFNRQQIIEVLSHWLPHQINSLDTNQNSVDSISDQSEKIPEKTGTDSNDENTLNLTLITEMKNTLGKVFNELIPAYLTQSDNIINDMQNTYHNKDFKTLERYAHSMKSSSYNVGAEWLSGESAQLEKMCQNNQKNNQKNIEIKSKIDSIINDYNAIKIKLLEYQKRDK